MPTITLKLAGIPGESFVSGAEKDIDIVSYSFEVSRPNASTANTSVAAAFRDATFVHRYDRAAPLLIQAAALGKPVDTAVLTVRRNGGIALTVRLTGVTVGSFSDSSDERPLQQFTLRFKKIELLYQPVTPTGSATAPPKVTAGYDLTTQKAFTPAS